MPASDATGESDTTTADGGRGERPPHVLVLAAESTYERIAERLEATHGMVIERAPSAGEALGRVVEPATTVDCLLVDERTEDGLAIVETVRDMRPDVPVVTRPLENDVGRDERLDLVGGQITHYVDRCRSLSELRGYRQAVDHAGHAIMVTRTDGAIEYVNDAFEEATGYDRDELLGMRPSILKSGVHDDAFYADLWQTILDGNVWRGELVNENRSGERYRIEQTIAPITNETGDIVRFVAVNKDVTERVERERALARSRKKFRSLVDTAPDAILIADVEDGRIVEANRAAEHLLGRPHEDIVGMNQTDLHPPEDGRRYRHLFERHVNAENAVYSRLPDGSDIYVVDAAGKKIPVEISARLLDLDGTKLLQGIFRDVSDRRAHERELNRQNERLEGFARTVAHDLRNPLTVVQGCLQLLEETENLDHLAPAVSSAERMEDLIEELLVLARQGQTVLDRTTVSLRESAETAWSHVETGNARLIIVEDGTIQADPNRLSQLLENLVSNAIEHAGDGVIVSVGMLDDETGIFVEDDGSGIDPAVRDRVFDSGFTTSREGTGYGLAIVEQIADAHGWTVRVDEAETGGARFEIETRGVT